MLFTVGYAATLLGYGSTDLLGRVRKYIRHRKGIQPTESAKGQVKIPVMKTSMAIGVYLAVSTNIRYQVSEIDGAGMVLKNGALRCVSSVCLTFNWSAVLVLLRFFFSLPSSS